MLCPFCLTNLKGPVNLCASCDHKLPSDYVRYHSGLLARFRPPAIVSVVGFSGHGKTVYLASLYYALQNVIPEAWDAFSRQGLTFESLKVLHDNLDRLKRGNLPDPTPHVFPEPNIDRLYKIPRFGDRTLLIYDTQGEAFDLISEESFQRFAGFVRHSPCVLFLISLSDMTERDGFEDTVGDKMHQLLERYNVGMSAMGVRVPFQHLIVVYTKADSLLSGFDIPGEIAKYLESSEVDTLADVGGYLQRMSHNSSLLRDFTRRKLKATVFLNNAKLHFKSSEFCAVSALGSNPTGLRLTERIAPRRVIDPLLWVLEKS